MSELRNWTELTVINDDGAEIGVLGELARDHAQELGTIEFNPDGSISEWPDHFLRGPDDEDYDWDTPRGAVNWTGFREVVHNEEKRK